MEKLIFVCGIYNLFFMVFHILFWKMFGWEKDLKKLIPHNKAIMQVFDTKLIYVFLIFSSICFLFDNELLETTFGNFILIAISIFWFTRFIEQFLFFDNKSPIEKVLIVILFLGGVIHLLPTL